MISKIPCGVAADDGVGVVLIHCRSAGNAKDIIYVNLADRTKADLKTQQTPKEEAQVPLAVPPAASHSLELGVGVVKFCISGGWVRISGDNLSVLCE